MHLNTSLFFKRSSDEHVTLLKESNIYETNVHLYRKQ